MRVDDMLRGGRGGGGISGLFAPEETAETETERALASGFADLKAPTDRLPWRGLGAVVRGLVAAEKAEPSSSSSTMASTFLPEDLRRGFDLASGPADPIVGPSLLVRRLLSAI